VFDLPDRVAAKRAASLIAADEEHFAAIAARLDSSIEEVSTLLDAQRKSPARAGQAALERDLEIHRLEGRLRTLRRYALDLCLGRTVALDGTRAYVGRIGLTDPEGERLLVDWRSPAAEPFFGATHAEPMGLESRRRYRWTDGRITDYWDEVFTAEGLVTSAALDDQSAFMASLSGSRSMKMRDVVATIQADQNRIIRASSRGALVVDGGPGTGKTVVALHRAAYLLYSEPRLTRGGVLFIGPSHAYLSYIDDVLPSLGEDGVQVATLRDLVPESRGALAEADPMVARLKASVGMVRAVERAVRLRELPPTTGMTVETPWADVWLSPAMWAEAFESADPALTHNDAAEGVWQALIEILVDELRDGRERHDDDEFDAYAIEQVDPDAALRDALATNADLAEAFSRAWPLLDPRDLVADLWSNPALLGRCAPMLSAAEIAALQRSRSAAWTVSDLPLVDAARLRLGDAGAVRRRRQEQAAIAEERSRMSRVIDDLIASDDSELKLMSMLRGQDLRATLVDRAALPSRDVDSLAGPFAHVLVDEAQELTDAEWQMILARCPSRSVTIVGDRAQARHGFTEPWQERLGRVGFDNVGFDSVTVATLSVNYRTPREVMVEAEPVIRAAIPDANVPTSIRSTGLPVVRGSVADLVTIVEGWLAQHDGGIVSVITASGNPPTDVELGSRVHVLSPQLAKGLEFDLVVLVDPAEFGDAIEGAVDRYVAMTRATQQLVILTTQSTRYPPASTHPFRVRP
jgi:DNA helicase IV